MNFRLSHVHFNLTHSKDSGSCKYIQWIFIGTVHEIKVYHLLFDWISVAFILSGKSYYYNKPEIKVKLLPVLFNRSKKLCDWSNAKSTEITAKIVIFILLTLAALIIIIMQIYFVYTDDTSSLLQLDLSLCFITKIKKCIFSHVSFASPGHYCSS